MPKRRMTFSLDDEVLRAVRAKALATDKQDSQVIEESLRRDLGRDELRDLWGRVEPVPEGDGMDLANAEVHAMREEMT